ncbi:MAG: YSC84-related protein [Candidatus Scalindua sp.]|nr:YSC84-related protein [Candidatus Scalindua sp.]
MRYVYLKIIILMLICTGGTLIDINSTVAASADKINRDAQSTLVSLYEKSPAAKALGEKVKAILVFPGIVKGGFIIGGQYGEGVLLKDGNPSAYYNTVQLSYGLQAGGQKYGYVLFFMSDSAMGWLDRSDGWELGVGPTIVVVDIGTAKAMTTTTLQSQIYAFFVNEKGLMGGLGLQGTKITKIQK